VLVLPNARTFGALEVLALLKVGGATADVTVAELQGLPFWYSKPDKALLLQPVAALDCACIPADRTQTTVESLSKFLPGITALTNVLQTSFTDCSGIVDIPTLLLGGVALKPGGKPMPIGAVPLPENDTFFNRIGEQQIDVINAMLTERKQVAQRFGVRTVPSTEAALQQYAGQATGQGSRPVPGQTEAIKLVRDTAIASLVPLMEAAQLADVGVPVTRSMVQLCSTVLGSDVATSGRRMHSIGIDAARFDAAFNRVSVIAKTGL